mgnify:CR=1 FL=1
MIKGVIAGNFDVIHPGYVAMFKEMRTKCDCLVVLLHSLFRQKSRLEHN